MDLDYYRDFMTIARVGTIAEAARQLRIAQPALSHRLKQLEEYLNAPLIKTDRGVRKIELTEAGEYLYERAQYLLSTEDNLKREVTHRVQGTAGILKVSLSPSTAMMFIRDYLVPFSRTYPQVQHRLNEVTINEQTNQLLAGESEIGVANAPLVHPDLFQILHTERERLLIASSQQSRWNASRQPIVSLEALRHTPLALSRGCAPIFLDACHKYEITPSVLSICTTRTAALIWARENRACAIVPEQEAENFSNEVYYTALDVPDLYVQKSFVIVRDRPLTKVAQNFLDFYNLTLAET